MAQPHSSRRKVVTILSDEEEDLTSQAVPSDPGEDEEPIKPQKRSTGKLKSVKNSNKAQQHSIATSSKRGSSQKSPTKSKTTKTKSKTAVKDLVAPNGRSIYSFFNSATERQLNSQPSASPEKRSTPQEAPEIIHDASEDEKTPSSGVILAKGSSTALAVRKRKVQHAESFESEYSVPPASQKFRKASGGERVPSFSIINEDKRPWTDQFAPKDLSELAVHKRKVADVRQWLDAAANGRRQKALILKGAAGTGKTTTIRILAQELKLKITEWKNLAGLDLSSEGSASSAAQFEDFVGRAGKSTGLKFTSDEIENPQAAAAGDFGDQMQLCDQKQLLLIEEFPNTFSRASSTLQSFRSAILQYLSAPSLPEGVAPTPIVMIISETLLSTNTALADSFTSHRLLGPELVNHPYLDTIEFNAVAPTILTKALETIVLKEARKSGRRKTPGPQVLKHLADSGDVRSAVSSLEFLCLRGDDGDVWSSKVMFTKPKKGKAETPLTQAEEEALRLISNRESTLGIFHAVGKVVYNKRVTSQSVSHPPSWLPQHRRDNVPENGVDELINELGTDASTFVAALHENYVLSCSGATAGGTLDHLLGCVNNISDADLLSIDRFSFGTRAFAGSATDSLRQDEMSLQIAVRGLLFDLPCPVHRVMPTDGKRGDAHRMFYPSSIKLWRKREEIEGVLDLLTARYQSGYATDDSQTRRQKQGTGASEVESWKLNNAFDIRSSDTDPEKASSTTTSSAKAEMLIERLPYMLHILIATSGTPKVIEQISTVTQIRSSLSTDEDDEADVEGDGDAAQEQWTTDQPDPEAVVKTTKPKPKHQKGIKFTEGGGLAIPVETRVEKLVLEDDDIVDD